MRHHPEVQRAVNSYQLGLPNMPTAGRSGELLGRGTGSSLEFQEYREYLPGDDIRHIDWAAYARSDSLMVRLYREEISPRTEILLDISRSMTTGPGTTGSGVKALVAKQLATLFSLLCGQIGGRPQLMLLDDSRPLRTLGIENLEVLESLPCEATSTLPDLFAGHAISLKKQAVRIVISDFLYPHDPDTLIRQLASDSSALWVIQLLNEWEANPTPVGGRRIIDVETTGEANLIIDRKSVAEYLQRLTRLQEELARSCRRAHATFATLIAERGLPTLCREDLCASRILRPV